MRGPGDFAGTRQWGLPAYRVGNVLRDFAILTEAREEARRLVADGTPAPGEEGHKLFERATARQAALGRGG